VSQASEEAQASESDVVVASCLFCRIVGGELPADVVVSSELSLSFRDIHPQAPTHVLVIPRRHIDDAAAVGSEDAEVLADMFVVARQVAESDGIAQSGYRLVLNIGNDAQNSVGHLHMHVLGGRPMSGSPG
jgi:histidine triad (HIT) family protein